MYECTILASYFSLVLSCPYVYSAYICVFGTYYHLLCAERYARFQSNKVHALKRVTFWGKETQVWVSIIEAGSWEKKRALPSA